MTFPQRAIGAARLEVPAFEEVEADQGATAQALLVVVLSSLAAGIGLSGTVDNAPVLSGVFLFLLLWVFWAVLAYGIGVHLMPEPQTRANVGELLRAIGFGTAPGVLRVFGFVPGLGSTIYGIATIWMLVALVIAIRQALDYRSTWRAAVVCLMALVIALAATAMVGAFVFILAEEVVS